jgi:rhodanese-related sulfurtransferase
VLKEEETRVVKTQSPSQALGYTGDISPQEAWDMLRDDAKAALVDVRTGVEWAFVGTPDLSELSKQTIQVSWQVFPTMQINDTFIETLNSALAEQGLGQEASLVFLCRSGQRSIAAAVAACKSGFENCYNVVGGFEGELDDNRHRGTGPCWKTANLAWTQR